MIMIYMSEHGYSMTRLSTKSNFFFKCFKTIYIVCCTSFLQVLYPVLFENVDSFLKKLKLLADGKTQVSMKKQVYSVSMDLISKVSRSSNA